MSGLVKEIVAWGITGEASGKKFVAIKKNGTFALHSEILSGKLKRPLNDSITQVRVESLSEAAELILRGGYHIRVYNSEIRQEYRRKPSEVEIIWS